MRAQNVENYSKAELHLCKVDPVMEQLIAEHGPGLVRTLPHGFASMVRIIVGQQLSTKAAASIYERLKVEIGGKITPKAISNLTDSRLRSAGLSRAKVVAVRDLAAKVTSRKVSFRKIEKMDDHEVTEHLTQVKGIGPWSAQMYLMFVLGRPDIFAEGDLGIRTAVQRLYGKRQLKRLGKFCVKWKPYRTVACWYLWRSLSNTPVTKTP